MGSMFRLSGSHSKIFFLAPLLIGIVFISQKSRLYTPFTENEGMFTCAAQEMVDFGSKLYRDVWDHKPPVLFVHAVLIRELSQLDELHVHLYVLFIHCLNAILILLLARKFGMTQMGCWLSAF